MVARRQGDPGEEAGARHDTDRPDLDVLRIGPNTLREGRRHEFQVRIEAREAQAGRGQVEEDNADVPIGDLVELPEDRLDSRAEALRPKREETAAGGVPDPDHAAT